MQRAIGLMSGTSMDGIDIALLDTDGEDRIAFGPTGGIGYADADRALLMAAVAPATAIADRRSRPAPVAQAERRLTDLHAQVIEAFLHDHQIDRRSIDVIGFHGQTVLHRPERRLTVQIGDADRLANLLGIPVVADLRVADVEAGGQGAPLVPVFHQALARAAGLPLPALVVNIGGVGNITLVSEQDDPMACDTGPGNALLDDLMTERTGQLCDRDGAMARTGRVDQVALDRLMQHPYFDRALPKSLDRNDFSREQVAHLSTADAAATLTAFTAESIARSLAHLPQQPRIAVVCGGGAYNPALMDALALALPCLLKPAESLGWRPDAIEAQAFAYLAVRSLRGLPLTFPTTTGVPNPLCGGVLFRSVTRAA